MATEPAKGILEIGNTLWIFIGLAVVVGSGFVGAYLQRHKSGGDDRPIYWNLIFFAFIGALFSGFAMLVVDADDRSGIALLFLGMIGGYAASIKELDLAKIEIEKLKLRQRFNDEHTEEEDDEDNHKNNAT